MHKQPQLIGFSDEGQLMRRREFITLVGSGTGFGAARNAIDYSHRLGNAHLIRARRRAKHYLQTDTAPIENPPLPRPKPPLLDATGDNPAVLISAFRHQHGEDSVVISAALTRIAARDSLDS
jgi:hypothetical protein